MSWISEPVSLNTYSFKQRPDVSPRIHVLSVQMALNEESELTRENSQMVDCDKFPADLGDSGSIITALPAVPPTSASIPSLATEYQPRAVECA